MESLPVIPGSESIQKENAYVQGERLIIAKEKSANSMTLRTFLLSYFRLDKWRFPNKCYIYKKSGYFSGAVLM